MLTAEAQRRAAAGEYVPALMERDTMGDLTHAMGRDRESRIDPRVGWGFSASERAIDPATGQVWSVSPNQELTLGKRVPLGPSPELSLLPPAGQVPPGAAPVETPLGPVQSPAPGTAPTIYPNMPPYYQQLMENHLRQLGVIP
jgi:hypothetical protein